MVITSRPLDDDFDPRRLLPRIVDSRALADWIAERWTGKRTRRIRCRCARSRRVESIGNTERGTTLTSGCHRA
jgi:hypothetical protein